MTIHTEDPTPSPRPPPLQNHYAEDRVHHLFWSKLSKYFVLTNLIRVRRIQQGHAYFPTLLLFFFLTPATAQQQQPFAKVRGDKTMAIVLLILVVLFFALGILSIYTRQCADRRLRGRLDLAILAAAGSIGSSSRRRRQQRGLDPAVVDSFPTFAYSAVKGALECAVCLSEFRDGERLRLIPDCCHVFHRDCIDVWLSTHSTCPVCRANLVPIPGDTSPSSPAINILDQPDPGPNNNGSNLVSRVNDDDRNRVILLAESQPHPERSASLDDEGRSVRAFRRSNSTGHSPVRAGEDSERFTVRLPEGVRDRLVDAGSLSRTTSCGVTFERERSGRWGYRTRSMGRNERLEGTEGQPDWLGLSWTPPFVGRRTGSNRSRKQANTAAASVADVEVDVGERSCDLLFPKD